MKLYQYDDLKKTNQALGSFKRNGIPVLEVNETVVENKVVFFVLTDPTVNEPEEAKTVKKSNGKTEKKTKEKKSKDSKGEGSVEPRVGEQTPDENSTDSK